MVQKSIFTLFMMTFMMTLMIYSIHATIDVEEYLRRYGYYDYVGYTGRKGEATSKALEIFQQTYGLKTTGTLNEETLELMRTPRCGVSDLLYNQPGNKWDREELSYYFVNYTPDIPREELKRLTRKAFQFWADVTPLTFQEKGIGNILIYYGRGKHHDTREPCYARFDGRGGELAHAFYPLDGRLHFDEDETFTSNTTYGVNYLWVATHEIGHVLGLEHDTTNRSAVMYPYYKKYDPKGMNLHPNDIKRIQDMYGPGGLYPTLHPPVCKDRLSNCHTIKQFCNSDQESWKEIARYKCKLTCGFCKPNIKPSSRPGTTIPPKNPTTKGAEKPATEKPNPDCKDTISNCHSLKSYCGSEQSSWKNLLQRKCRKTCHFCK